VGVGPSGRGGGARGGKELVRGRGGEKKKGDEKRLERT